jgi:hypothetical protein
MQSEGAIPAPLHRIAMTSMRLPALLTIAYLNGIGLFLAHDAATARAPQAVETGAQGCRAPLAGSHPPSAPDPGAA